MVKPDFDSADWGTSQLYDAQRAGNRRAAPTLAK
jgi:hypothetical protein